MAHWALTRLGAWARRVAAAALAASGRAVPCHVAFIMDGNRRFAEARCMRKVEGHAYGYRRLIEALEWCLELGVTCVSVYAFSIDNYRRSGEEVDTLMALAQEKLAHMLQECDVLARHGVQVRVIGDLSLAPAGVQQAAGDVMRATAHHTRAVLNLCFSYTASEELLQALDGLGARSIHGSSSIGSQDAVQQTPSAAAAAAPGTAAVAAAVPARPAGPAGSLDGLLYTSGCPPVDLLVRTSGETRLSDFLLWQSRHALLVFTPVLWPDFGFLDLVAAILEFQRHSAHLQRLRAAADTHAGTAVLQSRQHPQQQQRTEQQERHQREVQEEQQQQRLPAVKVSRLQPHCSSPCSVASPASPSSPSSRSETSAEEGAVLDAPLVAVKQLAAPSAPSTGEAGADRAALLLRKRHSLPAASLGVAL